MMVGMNSLKDDPITFNSYAQDRKDFVLIGNQDDPLSSEIVQKIKNKFIQQTGIQPEIIRYESISQMQKSFYDLQSQKKLKYLIPFGLDFTSLTKQLIFIRFLN